jgi:hypothetical protein
VRPRACCPGLLPDDIYQFGPLYIHPLFYYLPQLLYGRVVQHSTLQQCVVRLEETFFVLSVCPRYLFAAIMFHYTKCELGMLL